MKNPNPLLAFLIIGIVGSLWHFLYDWSGGNHFIGLFSPTSESIWEHLKILFFPSLLYSIIEYFIIKKRPENCISAAAIGLFSGLFSIVVLFYTYTGILGYHINFIDIAIFFVGLFISLYVKSLIVRKSKFPSKTARYVSLYIVVHLAILFGFWSFNPPSLGIFTPPVI